MLPTHPARVCGPLPVLFFSFLRPAFASDAPLSAERYIETVLRAHPVARQLEGLGAAADAERRVARLLPDPVLEYSRGQAEPVESPGTRGTETGWTVSQVIPWPGTYRAGKRAGDHAALGLRARSDGVRWELAARAREAFARLVAARTLRDVASAAEEDARSLRDLVTRRAELGETRDSDRIKAVVEWLRQQRALATAEREALAAEAIVRTLAVEPLPTPLEVRRDEPSPLPALDRDALRRRLLDHNPAQREARAEAERQLALLSVVHRERIPDLDLSLFWQREIDKKTNGFSLGVKVPLWNANRGAIARAQAASRIADAFASRVGLELRAEMEARVAELEVAAGQVVLLQGEIIPAATKSLSLVRLTYEEGETSLLDLLDAQRTFREAQREMAAAHLALEAALGAVQRLIGPDFNPWRPDR